ncbi:MAG: S-layer homology domain-containing protein [Chloroflexi bacterium]|nr:S-layer homology domain-containing protein [Chloroflexota bacterium]
MSTQNRSIAFRLFSTFALIALLFGAVGITPAHAGGGVLYVKPTATGTGDCLSWANACTLQAALGMSGPANPIWVMAGTHKTAPLPVRMSTFQLHENASVYGGFAGTETSLDQRDFETNVTILSGSFNPPNGNSYHVVTGANGAILDGFTITSGQADGEYPHYRGGGMYNDSASPILRNIIFQNNTAIYGGGLYNFNSNPTLENVTFENNSAFTYGGGIANNESNPLLTNVTFIHNEASGDVETLGGGMYSRGESVPTLTDVTFNGNSADYGGGMYNQNSHPSLTQVDFNGNKALFEGGGMYNANLSNPVLMNVTFVENSADNYGGGMSNYNDSSPSLTNVSFTDNTAVNAGGGMYNNDGHPTISSVGFIGNSAAGGGGLYNYSSHPVLTDVTLTTNTATYGGGMNNRDSNPTLTNVTFNGNTAVDYGGGMYNTLGSAPTLVNVTFSGNTATNGGGGGMYNTSSSPTLTNVTFSGNSAQGGGGIYNWSSNSIIRNTILWGNTAPNGPQIYNNSSSPTVSDSVIQNGYTSGTNIITADPLLGALGNNGGHTQTIPLLTGSSAFDAGNDSVCPDTDQRGVERPQHIRCDIGSYEYNGAVFTDVSFTHWANTFIERLYLQGITGGCGGGNYCPNNTVTRAQMAVFLLVAEHGTGYTPPDATGIFNDVPASNGFARWIEQLAAEGITGGCGGGNYCPNTPVTREQMAVFLLVAEHGTGYTPPAATGVFADVPAAYPFAPWIEQLAAEGITGGCGGGDFCPKTVVNRAQMAVFLVTAFNLP